MGCNVGLRKMVVLVVLNMCGGRGEWMDWVGVGVGVILSFNLHLICDTEVLYCYAAGIGHV